MKMPNLQLMTMGAALGAASLLSACHDDHAATPTGEASTQNFSQFAKDTFAKDENSTPVNFDSITLVADVDNDPTAFDSLLM